MSTTNLHPTFAPAPRRRRLSSAVACLGAAGVLLCASGLAQALVFHQASTLKYVLTVMGAGLVVWAALSPHPLRVVMVPAIVAAPFVGVSFGVGSQRFSVLLPFLVAGALLAPLTGVRQRTTSALAPAGILAFPLLLLPLAIGTNVQRFATTLALLLAVAWLVALTAREPGGMTAVLAAVALGAAVQSVIALWEARTGHLLNLYSLAGSRQFAADYLYTYGTTRRPTGTFSDPISLGNALAIALPLTIALAVRVRGRARTWSATGAALLIASALTLSLSRMSWIGALLGSILMLVSLPPGKRAAVGRAMALGAVVICVVAVAAAGPAVVGRLASIAHPTTVQGQPVVQQGVAEGDRNRLEYWRVSLLDGFAHHLPGGLGIGNLPAFLRDHVSTSGRGIRTGTAIYIHAHSTYLQLLAEGGLFALALLVLFLVGLVRDARASLSSDRILGSGLAGAATALLICWSTDWVIQNSPVAACVGILLGAIAAGGARGRAAIRGVPA